MVFEELTQSLIKVMAVHIRYVWRSEYSKSSNTKSDQDLRCSYEVSVALCVFEELPFSLIRAFAVRTWYPWRLEYSKN